MRDTKKQSIGRDKTYCRICISLGSPIRHESGQPPDENRRSSTTNAGISLAPHLATHSLAPQHRTLLPKSTARTKASVSSDSFEVEHVQQATAQANIITRSFDQILGVPYRDHRFVNAEHNYGDNVDTRIRHTYVFTGCTPRRI